MTRWNIKSEWEKRVAGNDKFIIENEKKQSKQTRAIDPCPEMTRNKHDIIDKGEEKSTKNRKREKESDRTELLLPLPLPLSSSFSLKYVLSWLLL